MYHDRYGLTDRPFQLTPDPRFWFESATHRKAMAYLGYGLAQGEGFIVITGEIGAGKTTLVGHLMATIDRARLTAVQLVSTQVDGDDMLRIAGQAFGLPVEGASKAGLLDRIERFLRDEARAGKRALLVVDEAQNLSRSALEELRMLSNFQDGGRSLLQIFLLGQPEFRDALAGGGLEQLRQRVIATHHLDAMGAAEIEPYVVYRLARVGWTGDPSFAIDAWSAFYRHSGGLPRRLNLLAGRVLLAASVEDGHRIDAALVEQVARELDTDARMPTAEDPAAPAHPDPVEGSIPAAHSTPFDAAQNRLRQAQGERNTGAQEETRPRVARGGSEEAPRFAAVTPLRPEPVREPDPDLLRRLVAMETKLEEQDRALKRVLGLLVEWVESDAPRPPVGRTRSHAA